VLVQLSQPSNGMGGAGSSVHWSMGVLRRGKRVYRFVAVEILADRGAAPNSPNYAVSGSVHAVHAVPVAMTMAVAQNNTYGAATVVPTAVPLINLTVAPAQPQAVAVAVPYTPQVLL
jgi:hypothetical protein